MRKLSLWLFAAILTICGLMVTTLTSCGNESIDNPTPMNPTEAQQKSELSGKLVGCQIDISPALMGDDAIVLWDMRQDGSFVMLEVETGDAEVDIDTLKGRWEPFVDAVNKWQPESGERLQGFKAIFDFDDDGIAEQDRTLTYYVDEAADEDGQPLLLVCGEFSLDYLMMTEDNDVPTATTRGFFDFIPGGFDALKKGLSMAKNLAVNIIGLDHWGDKLKEEDCKKFYEEANKALSQMREAYGAKTDYSQWMTEIYTNQGKNPRICEMNIPASHHSFTHYIGRTYTGQASWSRTQLKDIHGQWEAGVRCFELHLKDVHGNVTATELVFKHILGLFDDWYYLNCTAEEGVGYIIDELKKHPGETAIAFVYFDGTPTGDDFKMAYELFNPLIQQGKIMNNLTADVTLNDCAGKLILIQGWDQRNVHAEYRIGPTTSTYINFMGLFRYEYSKEEDIRFFNGESYTKASLYDQNLSSSSVFELVDDFWPKKKELATECFQDAQRTKGEVVNTWVLNHIDASVGGPVHLSFAKSSNVMNPWAVKYLTEHKGDKAGFVWMDFAGTNEMFDGYYTNGESLPRIIVETNRFQ